jgi:hypothetical protein
MKAKLGLGGYFTNTIDSIDSIIEYAYEKGIRIFDTSPVYNGSEPAFGRVLSKYDRNSYLIITKTKALTLEKFYIDLSNSLSFLKTNFIDVYFGHSYIDDMETYESAIEELEEMALLKEKGIIGKVGVSGHSLEAATYAIKNPIVDYIMIPNSIVYNEFENMIKFAKNKGKTVITMKNFASGILLGGSIINVYNSNVTIQDIMNYSSYVGDIIIPAARSKIQLKQIIETYENSYKLNKFEIEKLQDKIKYYLGNDFCRFCNKCRPCKKYGWQMSQPSILKAALYQEKFGLNMLDNYKKNKYTVKNCEECNDCKSICPFEINIKEKMIEADNLFKSIENEIKNIEEV